MFQPPHRGPCRRGASQPALQPSPATHAISEGVTPGLKIAINSTPTHFFGTRYPIECQKVSYTLYIVSKSVIYALYSVKKCLIHSISCYFQSWCFSLHKAGSAARSEENFLYKEHRAAVLPLYWMVETVNSTEAERELLADYQVPWVWKPLSSLHVMENVLQNSLKNSLKFS